MKIIIPGGAGYLGRAIAEHFARQGASVIILSRRAAATQGKIQTLVWDGKTIGPWAAALEGASAVINLTGRSVNCRYTEKNKKEILDSRLDSTSILGQAISQCQDPPKVWFNASSATIYEHTTSQAANDEYSSRIGQDFSMTVCQKWEACFGAFELPQTRKIALRMSIVISAEPGGAMEYLLWLSKWYLGGTQGSGQQFFSWIHLHDCIQAIDFLLQRPELHGVFNLAAPTPLPNAEIMALIRKATGRAWGLPCPKPLLKIGAVFLGTEPELVLKSRKVVSRRLAEAGFTFRYPHFQEAIQDIARGKSALE